MTSTVSEKKPEFGIVTYHDGYNFGAFLQVFALHKTLNQLGLKNVVLNYKNFKHWKAEYRCIFWTKNPLKLIRNIGKVLKFKKNQKLIAVSPFSFSRNFFKNQKFGGVFFGSDEIWNCANPLFEEDLFYFGKYLKGTKRISYAASCGALKVDEKLTPEISELLKEFSSISVRDENTRYLVESATGETPKIVLDPTLIYDFNGLEQEPLDDHFIMVYTTGFSPEQELSIRKYADSVEKKLISVGYYNKFCNQSIISIGPFDFLGYVKKADQVITSMFHGVLLSMKYQKNFCIIVDPYRTNKLESVMNNFSLHDRVIDDKLAFAEVLGSPINYEKIALVLEVGRVQSIQYIKDAVAK